MLTEVIHPLCRQPGIVFAAFIVLQVLAALHHQLVQRDGLLQRMGSGGCVNS
jgi:cytochrome b561